MIFILYIVIDIKDNNQPTNPLFSSLQAMDNYYYYYYSDSDKDNSYSGDSDEWEDNGSYTESTYSDDIEPADLTLVPLPKPSFMIREETDTANALSFLTPEPEEKISRPMWKKIDYTETPAPDPWAFLEEAKETKKKTSLQRREKDDMRRKPPRSSRPSSSLTTSSSRQSLLNPIDNSQTNRLCKYKDACRMNREGRCSMVHSIDQWKPRICRFQSNCSRKDGCGYYHPDIPPRQYLAVMLKKTDSIYYSNANLYEKYLS